MEWMLECAWGRVLLASVLLFGIMAGTARTARAESRSGDTGIVLAAFGSTVSEARAAYEKIEQAVHAACPGLETVWAYSSDQVRSALRDQGVIVDSPAQALARLAAKGYEKAVVLPLLVIPGEEFHALAGVCARFEGMPKGLQTVVLAHPLLGDADDAGRVAEILSATTRKDDEALVLMGHGSPHTADLCYPALQYFLDKHPGDAIMGTVEGTPDLEDVRAELISRNKTKVVLRPFMTVAGDHARNDMAGSEEDSWVSTLSRAGFSCRVLLDGLGGDPKIVDVWIGHLRRALETLKD